MDFRPVLRIVGILLATLSLANRSDGMLPGRLQLFTVIVLFTRSFWRG